MSSLKQELRFDLEWRITLFTLVMVPLMAGLGFWQLQRAQEKAHLAAAFEERQQQAPAPVSGLWDNTAESLAYLPVQLIGSFLPDKYFLLDNQVQHGSSVTKSWVSCSYPTAVVACWSTAGGWPVMLPDGPCRWCRW